MQPHRTACATTMFITPALTLGFMDSPVKISNCNLLAIDILNNNNLDL